MENKTLFIILGILVLVLILIFGFLGKNIFFEGKEDLNQTTEPVVNESETIVVCTENWDCEEWGSCINQTKKRECTDLNNCGSESIKPPISEGCCLWVCGDWEECFPGDIQFRKCTIEEGCDKKNKPIANQNCIYESGCQDTENQTNYFIKGVVTDVNGFNWEDSCRQDGYLIEKSCSELGEIENEYYQCPFGCEDGICIPPENCTNEDNYCPSNCTYINDSDCEIPDL